MIKVPSQLLGAPFGSELELKCEIEAMPKVNFSKKEIPIEKLLAIYTHTFFAVWHVCFIALLIECVSPVPNKTGKYIHALYARQQKWQKR